MDKCKRLGERTAYELDFMEVLLAVNLLARSIVSIEWYSDKQQGEALHTSE